MGAEIVEAKLCANCKSHTGCFTFSTIASLVSPALSINLAITQFCHFKGRNLVSVLDECWAPRGLRWDNGWSTVVAAASFYLCMSVIFKLLMVFIKTSHSIGHLKLQDRWKVLWSLVTGNVSVTAIRLCSSIKVTFKKAKEWPLQCRECDNTAVDPLLPIPVLCGNRLNVTHLKSSKTWSQKPLQLPDLALLPTAVCIYRQQLGKNRDIWEGLGI